MSKNQQDVSTTDNPRLGERFGQAFAMASRLHRRQIRKDSSDLPYLSHLMAVASLVLEAGADEDVAIAALLHDAAEDQGGEAVLQEITDRFGARVGHIVAGCSDTFVVPKPAWRKRKEDYIAHVRDEADADVSLVSAADKVHNARSILTDHYMVGDRVFERFKASKAETLWYYKSLLPAFAEALRRNGATGLNGGLRRLVTELEHVVRELLKQAGDEPCQG